MLTPKWYQFKWRLQKGIKVFGYKIDVWKLRNIGLPYFRFVNMMKQAIALNNAVAEYGLADGNIKQRYRFFISLNKKTYWQITFEKIKKGDLK